MREGGGGQVREGAETPRVPENWPCPDAGVTGWVMQMTGEDPCVSTEVLCRLGHLQAMPTAS